jgi:hypothetical protein
MNVLQVLSIELMAFGQAGESSKRMHASSFLNSDSNQRHELGMTPYNLPCLHLVAKNRMVCPLKSQAVQLAELD